MATLKMGSTTVLTDTTLANAVQDNIIRLGTVTTGTMNNTIGSSATFPNGIIRQVKYHKIADESTRTSSGNNPSTGVEFDAVILSDSDVVVMVNATMTMTDTNVDSHSYVYINGGGIGSGAVTAARITNALLYKQTQHMRENYSGFILDTAPGSTNPAYNCWYTVEASHEINTAEYTILLVELCSS